MHAPNLLVDVIPGSGAGSVEAWTANVDDFERQLDQIGWTVRGVFDRPRSYGDEWAHRYYHAVRA
jgi:hypothetical protein